MSQPTQVGREATHGTVSASFVSAPVNFNAKPVFEHQLPREEHGGQDVHFSLIPGVKRQEWSIDDSPFYHDVAGFWVGSAMGLPVSSLVESGVYDSVFKFLDDPISLSFKWGQPRRSTQGYQSLYGITTKLAFSFEQSGIIMFSAEGIAYAETEVTAPTHSFSTVRPIGVHLGAITLGGGSFARLRKGVVTISRDREAFYTINNTADPTDMDNGDRMVEFDLTADFNTKTEFDRYKAATTTGFTATFADTSQTIGAASNPTLTVKLGTVVYEEAEIDTGEKFPAVNLKGHALYNASDASTAVVTIRSTRQYQTA